MRLRLLWMLLAVALLGACRQGNEKTDKKRSPREVFPGLFEAVQSSAIFPDSKTFTDCIPKRDAEAILADYRDSKNKPGFNLKKFVDQNFSLPGDASKNFQSLNDTDVVAHIEKLWDVLSRQPEKGNPASSLITLPNPYVVPGGRFREVYYWDSYFTMLGLQQSKRVDMIEDMVNNFAFLIRNYGFIPNGNRSYYLTRSQPPFFSLMVQLLMDNKPAAADSVLKANTDALQAEYNFWMDGKKADGQVSNHVAYLPNGDILNRYYDRGDWPREEAYTEDQATAEASGRPVAQVYRELRSGAESGWDFSSRWFTDGRTLKTIATTEVVPVDLNCLLYNLEQLLATAYQKNGDDKTTKQLLEAANSRKLAIIKYCWDAKTGWYRDYSWKTSAQTKQLTLAGIYPLYFKIAPPNQATAIAATLQKQFLKLGGLVTTLAFTGQQWDAPNGWAPLQYMAIEGLKNYNETQLAEDIARRWSRTNIRVFKKTGKLLEKYNVIDTTLIAGGGEYPTQDGFGWTNGVLLNILKGNNKKVN